MLIVAGSTWGLASKSKARSDLSRGKVHPTESVASSYIKARDLVRNHERHGQSLERPGVRDALMRPVPVVELLELP